MDPQTTSKSTHSLFVSRIVKKYVGHHHLAATDVASLISTVGQALRQVGATTEPAEPSRTPAVPIRRSVTHDAVVCLDCGWRGVMLRRHIRTGHGLSVDEYRARWGLKLDHPLTAPGYSERRSVSAKEIGLGRGRKTADIPAAEPEATETVATAPKRTRRRGSRKSRRAAVG